MVEMSWEGWPTRTELRHGGPPWTAADTSPELAGNDVYASVLHEDGTGRSSGRRRTHLGTSLGQRWLGDGVGHGGADGAFL